MTQPELNRSLEQARLTVANMDAADRRFGFATPDAADAKQVLRTVIEACKAGLLTGQASCIAEAIVMLETEAARRR